MLQPCTQTAHGAYPIGCIGFYPAQPADGVPTFPQRFIAWNVQLLPFIDEMALWQAFNFALPSDDPANKAAAATVIDLFLCPSTIEAELFSRSGLWRGSCDDRLQRHLRRRRARP